MKQAIILSCLALAMHLSPPAYTQVVLNEIYSDPGAGRHEFFELYNTSTSTSAVSMDNYTIVTYFENSPQEKGFYVLDLPNLMVQPKGYFVGAAAIPFNYQGNIGATSANFSWNDPALSSNFGYLRQYQLTGPNNLPDNQKTFVAQAAPANLNNLFFKLKGNGASYSTFVYQNGNLVNAFFGGAGGGSSVPDYILNMPPLTVDLVKANADSSFTIDFSSYANHAIESVIETTGSDNGFIRKYDGLCGWNKSSANAFHTPGASNGNGVGVPGKLTIDVHMAIGTSPEDSSFIHYNVTNGPAELFPVNLQVYLDNGTDTAQLDAGDIFVAQNTETVVGDGPFSTSYLPQKQTVMLIAETNMGCLDQIVYLVPPPEVEGTVLPVQMQAFTAQEKADHNLLQWSVAHNEQGSFFEVQRSIDGRNFSRIGTIQATEKAGTETYHFNDAAATTGKIYYRLRIQHQNNAAAYSKVILLHQGKKVALTLLQNPVDQAVHFMYNAPDRERVQVTIYNAVGVKIHSSSAPCIAGNNLLTIQAGSQFATGMYVLEVSSKQQKSVVPFIKR